MNPFLAGPGCSIGCSTTGCVGFTGTGSVTGCTGVTSGTGCTGVTSGTGCADVASETTGCTGCSACPDTADRPCLSDPCPYRIGSADTAGMPGSRPPARNCCRIRRSAPRPAPWRPRWPAFPSVYSCPACSGKRCPR